MNNILEKLKAINIKNVVRSFTLIWGVILIVIMTLVNLGFDKNFNFLNWLSNSLIIFGIIVYGLLMGESWGKDNRKHDKKGLYYTKLNEFEKLLDSLQDEICYFGQYYIWELGRENRDKKITHLLSTGMSQQKAEYIVDNLTKEDFEDIKQHPIIINDQINIRKLEENEIEKVGEVLNGKIKVNPDSIVYFLSSYDDESENLTQSLELGNKINKERKKNKNGRRIIKIFSSLGISLIFGALTVKELASGDNMQAWANLISRVFALFSSFLSGWLSGAIDIKLQATQLIGKIKVLNAFHNALVKKHFTPKQESELAQEEYNKWLEEQQRLANDTPNGVELQ